MAVVIRLKRLGRKARPSYRISVADSRDPRDGRTLETLGLYDPIAKAEMQGGLNVERARHWLSEGAQPSDTVRSLFKKRGVFEGWSLPPKKKNDRSGRKKVTAKRTKKLSEQAARTAGKAIRLSARVAAKKAAAAPVAETAGA
jgi:small subunit ribosomal protein S16